LIWRTAILKLTFIFCHGRAKIALYFLLMGSKKTNSEVIHGYP
jgi:hypothetical protein